MGGLRSIPGWSLAGVVILALVGCDGVQPDVTPPKPVTDLAVAAVSESTVTLGWTSPENDGIHLRVESYDVRYAQGNAPRNWESGTRVSFPDKPQPPGNPERLTVPGLVREQEYAFTVRSADRSGNWSPWSKPIAGQPADDEPPGAIEDLTAQVVSASTVILTWTAPGDDGDTGTVSGYRVRWTGSAMTEADWAGATPLGVSLEPSAPGSGERLELTGLTPATDYWFAVRAVDDGGNESPWVRSVNGPTPRVPRTWVVALDGSGDRETVQGGIDAAIKGDTVLVERGRYYEDIDFLGKDLVVRSAQGPEVTILDGSREDSSVVNFKRNETRAAVLEGFTITGGHGTLEGTDYHEGGGIWCSGASPTIRGNHIVDNHIEDIYGWGGGLLVASYREPPLIEGNLIEGNSGRSNGGGMGVYSAAEIRGNVFRRNHAGADGGGVHIYLSIDDPGIVSVIGNEFWENVADDHGGGIEAYHGKDRGPFYIERNLFVRNEARGAGVPEDNGAGGAISSRPMTGTIRWNTFVANIGVGRAECGGGAILLAYMDRGPQLITDNIIVGSLGCGLDCFHKVPIFRPEIRNNIFWDNNPTHILDEVGCTPGWESDNTIADPLFCDPEHDDYRLASNSPAFQGEEVIGAYSNPGCGPRSVSQPSQWGLAPVRYP